MLKLTLITVCLCIAISLFAQVPPTSADQRLKGLEKKSALIAQSVINQIPFRNVGPSIMSGRVVDLAVNPKSPTQFYVAYATGGLWYTQNNGQSFTSVFDSVHVITIGAIAVDWTSGTIWVGTGEVNSSRSSYAGLGVYKSNNRGKTWQYMGLPESHHIGKIVLHPTNKNIAWVAVLGHLYSPNIERGVYKTTDGGKTWKQTLFVNENTGVVDLDIQSKNPSVLYAAAWYRTRTAANFEESGASSGIYKSTDGGNSWKLITNEGAGFPVGKGVGRIGLATAHQHSNWVYAVVDNNFHLPDTAKKMTDTSKYTLTDFKHLSKEAFLALDNKKLNTFLRLRRNGIPEKYTAEIIKEKVKANELKPTCIWDYLMDANTALFTTPIIGCEVYRSEDAGKTWKKMNDKQLKLYNTYGYYFGKIFASAANDDKLVITGFDVELSADGGKTFKPINNVLTHADHHIAWINPADDQHMIIGNDGGCNITYDDGAHWFKANTPSVGQFYSVTYDMATPYNVYGGLQDNGSWFGPSNHKENPGWMASGSYAFKPINGGDGMQVQVDWSDNTTVYSGFQFGNYMRSNKNRRVSVDEPDADAVPGESESSIKSVAAANAKEDSTIYIHPRGDLGEAPLRFNWQTPILLSRHNQDILYYGSNKFQRSLHRGEDLETLSNDLTTNPPQGNVPFGTLTTISESPLKFGLLYAGADDGSLHVSFDDGYTWQSIQDGLPKGLYVSRVTASAFKENRVYVSLNGYRNDDFKPYLFVSDDYGKTWKSIGADLPYESINVIKEDNKLSNVIYVGTDGGLYVSADNGTTFMGWNNGLPFSIPVHDIAIQPIANEIILGTHGRSIYIAPLKEVQAKLKK
ncbi:WD40/YVTN/BNR-like repeat-containing protein [Hydrotalea flava]|uniref:WD40/YVTN/BNR-like repeat-containing protein n=1 Tax=Hydrotalea flava TaxID=714549 RepID=UPI000B0BA2D8|nr:glycosyl hydrolase [Hydrotalea flava]